MSMPRFGSRAVEVARVASIASLASLIACAALTISACGSRGPLDSDLADWEGGAPGTVDGSVDVDGATSGDGATKSDAPVTQGDARADSGLPPIVNCGACIAQNCGQQIFACLADTACRATFQCVVTKCIAGGGGGGGPDPQCLFTCAGSDSQGAVQVLRIFTCIINKCGPDCQAILGGGGGGGGRDAGAGGKQLAPACEAFTRWPEVCSQTADVNGAGE